MKTGEKLTHQLQEVLSGEPWYGPSIYDILAHVTFESAYERPLPAAHTVTEIILHMLSWTEEVMDRLNGMAASSTPSSGDWPEPGVPDEQKWQLWIDDLKLANVNLLKIISDFPEEQWPEPTNDTRYEQAATYQELVEGFIQHQVYHAGQIAILTTSPKPSPKERA